MQRLLNLYERLLDLSLIQIVARLFIFLLLTLQKQFNTSLFNVHMHKVFKHTSAERG